MTTEISMGVFNLGLACTVVCGFALITGIAYVFIAFAEHCCKVSDLHDNIIKKKGK